MIKKYKKGQFKIGHGDLGTKESHRKQGQKMMGDNNHRWQEENVSYRAIHGWVGRWKGRPQNCQGCGKLGKKNGNNWSIHWANIDHTYKRILEDYIALCVSCHRKYDIKNNNYQGLVGGKVRKLRTENNV